MENEAPSYFERRQTRIILAAFAAFMVILGAGYYAFFRTDYTILYSDLRPADASIIVTELQSKHISYKLKHGGTTILVPENDADALRLDIGRSEASEKGVTGFEIFNKSDMGLTDFAQKINYQRALQGELARTILALDDIADARVHLALPERSLFRGNRAQPKAAVTITTRNGVALSEPRIAGIQRLVAAAVPDLALRDVVVLNELGQLVSPTVEEMEDTPQVEEEIAAQQYFRARARSAIQKVLPGQSFEVHVLLLSRSDAPEASGWSALADSTKSQPAGSVDQTGNRSPRNFGLRIFVVTADALTAEERSLASNAVTDALALDPTAGDSLRFGVGLPGSTGSRTEPAIRTEGDLGVSKIDSDENRDRAIWPNWLLAITGPTAIALIALILRRRQYALTFEQRASFIDRIRTLLHPASPGADVHG